MADGRDVLEHFVPRLLDLDHVHLGPRRHDVRDDDVAQLDDALDHLAGFFFEQPFAVALGDDRANFLFERFLVGLAAALRPASRRSTPSNRLRHARRAATSAGSTNRQHGQVRYRNRSAPTRTIAHGKQTTATADDQREHHHNRQPTRARRRLR